MMPFLMASDGVALHYTDEGTGPPILLVHGWTFSGEVFRHNTDALARRHRVVTVDLRGHGRSGKEPIGWTAAQSARDLRLVIDHLDLQAVTVVGWSLGVTVLFNYLAEYGSDRLAGLVFIEMTPHLLLEPDWPHAAFGTMDARAAIDLARDLVADPLAFRSAFIPACFAGAQSPDPATTEWWVEQSMLTSTPATLAYLVAMVGYDHRPLLASIDVPVLLCYGAQSAVYPTAVGEQLSEEIGDATLSVFEHSGHALFWEEPTELNDAVAQFVTRTAPAPPPPTPR
jgi:non-heme chloroperoxidase